MGVGLGGRLRAQLDHALPKRARACWHYAGTCRRILGGVPLERPVEEEVDVLEQVVRVERCFKGERPCEGRHRGDGRTRHS